MNLEALIGLEIHVEVKAKAKVFSTSKSSYGDKPNTNINVIDLGYPGTLPNLNKVVITQAIKAAKILNCEINKVIHFDRKNYFYPDVAKNFQITQAKTPLGYGGYIDIEIDDYSKRIHIDRVHIEEDTAKSIHRGNKTLLDFNRAGIALIEIVTKPDISNGKEAVAFVKTLSQLLLYGEISDVKIEEGSMRCDVNVSLKKKDDVVLGKKVEIKNVASINQISDIIDYEIKRQQKLLENKIPIHEETRRYDEKTKETILMRTKETGNDYRYFPEPDIPVVEITPDWIKEAVATIPLLPYLRKETYLNLNINEIVVTKLLQNKEVADFFEKLLAFDINFVTAANLLTTDIVGYLNKEKVSLSEIKLEITNFVKLVTLLDEGVLSSKIVKELLPTFLTSGKDIETLMKDKQITLINDKETLITIVNQVIANNLNSVTDYKNGKDRAIKYLMGEIMKITKGQAHPVLAKELLIAILSKQ